MESGGPRIGRIYKEGCSCPAKGMTLVESREGKERNRAAQGVRRHYLGVLGKDEG